LRYVRLLIPLVLLCIAAPAFALCGHCGGYDGNTCVWAPGEGTSCRMEHYICFSLCVEQGNAHCRPRSAAANSFGSEFRILSVTVEDAKASLVEKESAVLPSKTLKKKT
jgi:hypothetical protein